MKLGIIGTGNMAEALIAGLVSKRILLPRQIVGFDIRRSQLRLIQKKYKIKAAKNLTSLSRKSDLLLLAVKPQQMAMVLIDLKPSIRKKQLILSIAAGIDTQFMEQTLGRDKKIIRLMPNTPALVGLGATVFFANRRCQASDKKITRKLFGAVGLIVEVKREKLLDAVTGLSGSGPAFLYSFAQALAKGGRQSGLPAQLSQQLTVQTVIGASTLLGQTKMTPESLIARVASKGGTTEAGLKVLEKKKFRDIVARCIQAATRRARELRTR